MNALTLFNDLRRQGVVFSTDGVVLQITAPKGLITDQIKAQLTQSKPEILKALALQLVHSGPGKPSKRIERKTYKITVRGKPITVLDASGRSHEEMMKYFKNKFGDALNNAV